MVVVVVVVYMVSLFGIREKKNNVLVSSLHLTTPGSLVKAADQLRYNTRGFIVLHQGLKDLVVHLKVLGQKRN